MIHAAASTFEVRESVGTRSFNLTSAPIEAVYGPLKTTVTLLKSDETICIVASHILTHTHQIYRAIQQTVRQVMNYRYTRRPPYRKPAGDTLAHTAIQELKHLFRFNNQPHSEK